MYITGAMTTVKFVLQRCMCEVVATLRKLKRGFYNQLDRVYDSIPHRTRKIIIGDLNAKTCINRQKIYGSYER